METVIRCPRILVWVTSDGVDEEKLKLPSEFVRKYGRDMPINCGLQFPHGQQIDVLYKEDEESLCQLNVLIREYRTGTSIIMTLRYKGSGIFFCNILGKGRTEIEYGIAENVRAHVFRQDIEGGIGWKFWSVGIGGILNEGKTDVPKTFLKRFGKQLPKNITVGFRHGEKFECYLTKDNDGVWINGLRQLYAKKYLQIYDILMFTYAGAGRFEVCIFDRQKLEKIFPGPYDESESKSETESDSNNDSDTENEDNNPANEMGVVGIEEDQDNVERQFIVTMTASNTNSTSHGVYIPRWINPTQRQWVAGEDVLLQTDNGEWTVGLVTSGDKPRFSAGWNKFVRENKIVVNDTLIFDLVEDDEEGCVFRVEIQHDV